MLKNIEKAEKNFHSPVKKTIKEKFVLEEHDNPDVPLSHAAMPTLNTHSGAWSNRAGMWPLSDRRLVFTTRKEEVAEEWLSRMRNAFDPEKYREDEMKEILEENVQGKDKDEDEEDISKVDTADDKEGLIIRC